MPVSLMDAAQLLEIPNGWMHEISFVTDEIILRDEHARIVGGVSRKEIDDNLAQARVDEIVRKNTDAGDAKVSEAH